MTAPRVAAASAAPRSPAAPAWMGWLAGAALLLLTVWLLQRVHGPEPADAEGSRNTLLAALVAWAFVFWRVLDRLSLLEQPKALRLLAPALLGAGLLLVWEVVVVGWNVPRVLLPAPHAVAKALALRWEVLWPDFQQTAIAVAAGWAIGCGSGLLAALLCDRVDFLKRGLLPLAGLAGAVPIVGIAPIMVMWFGFDWQSKAAVAATVTFFPMLVNTLAGLAATDPMHRDLMRTYAATHGTTLAKLRLPGALPFIFNALKINSTLALISAIVAEFFGSPIYGLGFRISAEVARMNVDVVWAAIALSALAGSLFYGLIALVERGLTFWHPSYRQ
jgi:NitT/TauT family transport system permease protein